MPASSLTGLIDEYKQNPDLTYQSWFLHNEDRLKAFRSIRRGVLQVISDIKDGSFPNDFKGIGKFGDSHRVLEKIARALNL